MYKSISINVGQIRFKWNTLVPYLGKVRETLVNFTNTSVPEENLAKSIV